MTGAERSKSVLVTFGEAMLRLSPPHFQRLEQVHTLDVNVGGSELNVAVAAQRLGMDSSYVTRLPENALGRMVAGKAREHGVNTEHIAWAQEGRTGLYFVEFGASPRANSVLYDRGDSAIALVQPGEIDWEGVLAGARHFHTSGITPALSQSAAEVTMEAVRAAKEMGLTTSIDLNYRQRLWSESKAREVMTDMMPYTDILITTEEDTARVFGIRSEVYEGVAQQLAEDFGLSAVVITLRETPSVWRNQWSGMVYADGSVIHGPSYEIELVDRVGAGDAFAGGFLYGWLSNGPREGIRYGVAISALKQTNPGDLCWANKEDCDRLLAGGSLRIQR